MLRLIAFATLSVCVLAILHTAVVYPLLTFVLARIRRKSIAREPITPTVSFLIAAFNEEACIASKIENTLAFDYPPNLLEPIVVSDGSTDGTDQIVRSYVARGIRLIRAEGRVGKSAAMNIAVTAARGEIIVFSDAPAMFMPGAVRTLTSYFADPCVGGVAGRVEYTYDNSMVAKGFRIYQNFILQQRMNESRFGDQIHLTGAIHAIRRSCFAPCPADISPEHWFAAEIVRRGLRTVYADDAICIELSRNEARSELRARARIGLHAFSFLKHLFRSGLSNYRRMYLFQLMSHKALRWCMPAILTLLLLATTFLSLESRPYVMLVMLQVALYSASVGALAFPRIAARIPGLPVAGFVMIFLTGAAIGGCRALIGQGQTAWQTERSNPA